MREHEPVDPHTWSSVRRHPRRDQTSLVVDDVRLLAGRGAIVAGVGETITGRLLILDAQSMRWREVRLVRDPLCPVCEARP